VLLRLLRLVKLIGCPNTNGLFIEDPETKILGLMLLVGCCCDGCCDDCGCDDD
jgi:hypothetical protein